MPPLPLRWPGFFVPLSVTLAASALTSTGPLPIRVRLRPLSAADFLAGRVLSLIEERSILPTTLKLIPALGVEGRKISGSRTVGSSAAGAALGSGFAAGAGSGAGAGFGSGLGSALGAGASTLGAGAGAGSGLGSGLTSTLGSGFTSGAGASALGAGAGFGLGSAFALATGLASAFFSVAMEPLILRLGRRSSGTTVSMCFTFAGVGSAAGASGLAAGLAGAGLAVAPLRVSRSAAISALPMPLPCSAMSCSATSRGTRVLGVIVLTSKMFFFSNESLNEPIPTLSSLAKVKSLMSFGMYLLF